ncbi:MAG TPA: ECF-type sigma factor, partial [Humisphaera sp.]
SSVLDLVAAADAGDADRVLAFDDALRRLEAEAPLAAQVVRLRFYAGLTVPEVAEAERVAPRTVDREWAFARAWLYRVLSEDLGPG